MRGTAAANGSIRRNYSQCC